MLVIACQGFGQKDKLIPLPAGSIKPTGWLKLQMEKDLNGFVGNLDNSVPDLIYDPIYGRGRLQKHSKAKDLGNLKSGDAEGDEQYKWWNSETQSNWWDGYIRNVFLVGDKKGIEKVSKYIDTILATQDDDGYIGIYDKELRYKFSSENGELWSKASLYRGLVAYYEFTGDKKVFKVLERAVQNVMDNYPINASSPFYSGNGFNAGVSHGLTITDVLDRMSYHTGDPKYRNYALFLYKDFSNTQQSEKDAQLPNILKPDYRLQSHGVHSYEHIRPLTVAAYASPSDELDKALEIYLARIRSVVTISGGAIGDEWIGKRSADATNTGYEYCSLQELLDSYCLLMQKTGAASLGDEIENIFFNAAQGSRHPEHSAIAYLKTDNSFEMMGTRNGDVEPDRKQTRYKYSPAHQDVAVCCSPNAGRISPYFIQNAWMKADDRTLVAALLMPNVLETNTRQGKIRVETVTNYPYENSFQFNIKLQRPGELVFKIRKPSWVTSVSTTESFSEENGYIVIGRKFGAQDRISISFNTGVRVRNDNKGDHYFSHGALLYARPIQALEIKDRLYTDRLADYQYKPIDQIRYSFSAKQPPIFQNGVIRVELVNNSNNRTEQVELIPFGKTVLRQVTFK